MNEVRTKADQILKKGKSRMPAMDLSFLDFFFQRIQLLKPHNLKTSRPHKFKTINPNFFPKNPLQCQLFYVFFFAAWNNTKPKKPKIWEDLYIQSIPTSFSRYAKTARSMLTRQAWSMILWTWRSTSMYFLPVRVASVSHCQRNVIIVYRRLTIIFCRI